MRPYGQAMRECDRLDSHLAIDDNKQTHDTLVDIVGDYQHGVWLGANDKAKKVNIYFGGREMAQLKCYVQIESCN